MRRFAMAALLAVALPAPAAAQFTVFPTASDTPHVSSTGMGEVTAPAARATALFVFEAEGGDLADVAAQALVRRDAATAVLRRLGMDESSYSVVSFGAAPSMVLNRPRAPDQPTPPLMQESKGALRVTIEPVERLDEVVAAVLGAGAGSLMSVSFEPDDGADLRREATLQAMARARTEAEAMAEAEGMSLGRLIQVTSTPDYVRQNLVGNMIRATQSQGVPVLASDLTVRVMVQVVWELVPR